MAYKIVTAGELREVAPVNGEAKLFRASSEQYWVNVVHKDHAETLVAEAHDHEADLYIIIEGTGELYLGGTLINPTTPTPGQQRGSGLQGATRHTVQAGDLVIIPEGTPHMLDVRASRLVYTVVKIDLGGGAA